MPIPHLRLAFVLGLLPFAACLCGPQKAGDPCNDDDDDCPEAFVCQEDDDGDARCHVLVGGTCDADLDDDEVFCADGTTCSGTGEDAFCGGQGSLCAEGVCADALDCAPVVDGEPTCAPPLRLRGVVIEVGSEDPIADAHVVALDVEGTALTRVAVTGADGRYDLAVPGVPRNADGSPAEGAITLRASAREHATFPSGLRTALPIDLSIASVENEEDDVGYVVDNELTVIALLELPAAQQGRPVIAGRVVGVGAAGAGMLVVAEGAVRGQSAVVDVDGTFTVFNVAPGETTLKGYAAGIAVEPQTVTVRDADMTGVELVAAGADNTVVTGSVQVVNGNGFSETSVVLVPESVFDETFVRGEVPRGLRAPDNGPPSVDGAWSIAAVPPGRYVVLAGFENDGLVRDPDPNISGTQIVRLDIAGAAVDISSGFKITGALPVVSPGSDGLEVITTATPTLRFGDDSSEDFYEVVVFDAFGDVVHEQQVPGVSGSGTVDVAWGGPALAPGFYQFKATSFRQQGNGPAGPISTTEDLKGVFEVRAP